jgi:hypothetical protein
MAEILESIDGIARRLNRDVYYLALVDGDGERLDIYTDISEITDWLDAHRIGWALCMGFNEETVWFEGGPGCIFLDVHPEIDAAAMQQVEAHFMDGAGEPAIAGYVPAIMELKVARRFSERDRPDFWDAF